MSPPKGPVPVFNCVIDVEPPGPDGVILARVVNLPGIEVTAKSEREALSAAATRFKTEVSRMHASGEPIPWAEVRPPAAGALRRFIAVHL